MAFGRFDETTAPVSSALENTRDNTRKQQSHVLSQAVKQAELKTLLQGITEKDMQLEEQKVLHEANMNYAKGKVETSRALLQNNNKLTSATLNKVEEELVKSYDSLDTTQKEVISRGIPAITQQADPQMKQQAYEQMLKSLKSNPGVQKVLTDLGATGNVNDASTRLALKHIQSVTTNTQAQRQQEQLKTVESDLELEKMEAAFGYNSYLQNDQQAHELVLQRNKVSAALQEAAITASSKGAKWADPSNSEAGKLMFDALSTDIVTMGLISNEDLSDEGEAGDTKSILNQMASSAMYTLHDIEKENRYRKTPLNTQQMVSLAKNRTLQRVDLDGNFHSSPTSEELESSKREFHKISRRFLESREGAAFLGGQDVWRNMTQRDQEEYLDLMFGDANARKTVEPLRNKKDYSTRQR